MLKTKTACPPDQYFELVKKFPLRRLRNSSQHALAVEMLIQTSLARQSDRDPAVLDYLDILAGLIDEYEKAAALKADTSRRAPADVIRHLISSNHLTISSLAKEIGLGQSNLSEMLSGRRDFSKAAIAKLCDRFALNANIFF